MPPRPNVTGGAKFLVQQTYGSVNLENVLNLMKGTAGSLSSWTAADLASVAETMFDSWNTRFKTLQTTGLTLKTVTGQALDGTETFGTFSGSEAGTNADPAFTSQTSVCISWPVPAAYRGGHFRTYISGITSTGQSNAQSMTSGQGTAWATAAASFRSDINAIMLGDFPVVLSGISYVRNKEERDPPVVFSLGVPDVDVRYASTRRRLGKLGARET